MYKKGDKVRNKKTGEIDTVVSVPGMREYDKCDFFSADEGFVLESRLWERQEDWEPVQKQFIVHCPTEELWRRVQEKMFSEGYEWRGGEKYIDYLAKYEDQSCISIIEDCDYEMTYESKPYYEHECPTIPIISAEEYLGEEENVFFRGTTSPVFPEKLRDTYIYSGVDHTENFKFVGSCDWAEPIKNSPIKEHKNPIMTGLKKVTNFIDSLQEPLKSYIRLGWVELEEDKYYVTSDGKQADAEIKFGLVKHKTLEAYAEAEVKRLEKEEKKK